MKPIKEIEFIIEGEFIELVQLLKAIGLAQTGGHAKMIVDEEMVLRNGELETRKRAKLKPLEVIEVAQFKVFLK